MFATVYKKRKPCQNCRQFHRYVTWKCQPIVTNTKEEMEHVFPEAHFGKSEEVNLKEGEFITVNNWIRAQCEGDSEEVIQKSIKAFWKPHK